MTRVHRAVLGFARALAVAGGVVLSLLILITCVSILGRAANGLLHSETVMGLAPGLAQGLIDLGVGAIRGDFEMVEAGMAFVVFAFLPLCQVTAGHASVDVFTNALPGRVQRVLSVLIDALFALALVVIALQLKEGMDSRIRSGQTTLLLQVPVWWGYAAALAGAVSAAAVQVWMVVLRVAELAAGRPLAAPDGGAEP
jgi:hypothetical protein